MYSSNSESEGNSLELLSCSYLTCFDNMPSACSISTCLTTKEKET